jgi:hypothetical protein
MPFPWRRNLDGILRVGVQQRVNSFRCPVLKIILWTAQMLVLLTFVYPKTRLQPKLEIEEQKRSASQANCHKCQLLD